MLLLYSNKSLGFNSMDSRFCRTVTLFIGSTVKGTTLEMAIAWLSKRERL